MKEFRKKIEKKPDDPVPQEALDQIEQYKAALNEADLTKLSFFIAMHLVDDRVTASMIGSPAELMTGLMELIAQLTMGQPQMQKVFVALLLAKFAEIAGQPPTDPHNLSEIPLDISHLLKE